MVPIVELMFQKTGTDCKFYKADVWELALKEPSVPVSGGVASDHLPSEILGIESIKQGINKGYNDLM